MPLLSNKHEQIDKLTIETQKALGGGVFHEQNAHLKASIELDNGALHHMTPNTFPTPIDNQKGGGSNRTYRGEVANGSLPTLCIQTYIKKNMNNKR